MSCSSFIYGHSFDSGTKPESEDAREVEYQSYPGQSRLGTTPTRPATASPTRTAVAIQGTGVRLLYAQLQVSDFMGVRRVVDRVGWWWW